MKSLKEVLFLFVSNCFRHTTVLDYFYQVFGIIIIYPIRYLRPANTYIYSLPAKAYIKA